MEIPERVFARALANRHQAGDCIISNYSIGSHGYAQIGWYDGQRTQMRLVHRVVWEWHYLLPADLTIDHICHNRRCSNPLHLRLLTRAANAVSGGNAIKTHCVRGHEFDQANTRMVGNGKHRRRCIACERARNAARAA